MPYNNKLLADALRPIYNKGNSWGEFLADTHIAYDYYKQLNNTGRKLVNTFGSGAAIGIDDYYHPLLQCQLAKISDESQSNGLTLGEAKEVFDFYKKTILQGKNEQETQKDCIKDLNNNVYGCIIGHNNKLKSCLELLDDKRTENMRKLGIR